MIRFANAEDDRKKAGETSRQSTIDIPRGILGEFSGEGIADLVILS